jgi:hypothetical protein
MALRMTTSYRLQAAQMNEELPRESSLNFTLTHHFHDEDPKPEEMCPHLEVEALQTWYYCIFSNFGTLVILLKVDPIFGDELEIVCKGFYKTKDTCIFAWSSIPDIRHYCWLRGLTC